MYLFDDALSLICEFQVLLMQCVDLGIEMIQISVIYDDIVRFT